MSILGTDPFTVASGANTYAYDAMNRLTNMNSGQILITYDGDGNRVSKKVGGTNTYYLVDEQNPSGYAQVFEEWTVTATSTNLGRVYNYGLDLINQRVPNTSTNFFIFDGHGSTRALVDMGGNMVNAFVYDAYGTLIASNAAPQTAYLYCGQQFDSDLGFYYQRARYLNQNTGRFWTMDTYQGNNEDPLSLHKYLYCEANPINMMDLSGFYSSNEQQLGYGAENAIQSNYKMTHSLIQWPFISFGTYQYYNAADYLKPDIFNKYPGEMHFLEIKPISPGGIASGELKIILNALTYGPTYTPDINWQPVPHVLTTSNGKQIFAMNIGGVVYYQDIDELEMDLLAAAVITTPKELLEFLTPSAQIAPVISRINVLIRLAIPAMEADAAVDE